MRAPRRTLALAALVLVLAAVVGAPVTNSLQPFSSDDPGSQSVAARQAIEQATGVDPYFNLIALVPTPAGIGGSSARSEVAKVEDVLRSDPAVAGVRDYYLERNPAMLARDGRSTFVLGELRALPIASQLAGARRVEHRLSPLQGVKLGGLASFYAQGNDTARQDLIKAELFAFPLLLLIALWVFRGVIAATLPLVIGAVTVVSTLALLRLTNQFMGVSIYALNIATALGLGLAVDYSLLIISRYREEMARTGPGSAALSRTLATAGRTIVISSLTVAGVLSCLLVFPQSFLRSIGVGSIFVALIAGASALIILPAILTLLRWRVNSLAPTRWRRAAHDAARPSSASAWYRISRLVARYPLWTALTSAVILLGLASPALNLRITQVDANVVPEGSSDRVVYEAIARGYPSTDNAPVFLAVSAPPTGASRSGLASYAARLRGLPDVAAVQGPDPLGPRLWQIDVIPSSTPLSPASQHLVSAIRAVPSRFPVKAGGESASLVDLKHSLKARLPIALAILIAVTAIAVLLMTGSVVLPIVALAMNTLTIAAVFGAMVLVFQRGALEGLLDYTSSHALEPSTLVLIFALAFGLATDYGIFLLSRIKEMRDRGEPDAAAVANGVERTGRIVTAAALLLCVALGSLMTARHSLVKEVGFGAALSVAIDATVVRAMLLPSLMLLLGRLTWLSLRALRRSSPPAVGEGSGAAPRSDLQASPGHALSRAPSDPRPADARDALVATRFSDHDHPSVRDALEALRADTRAEGDVAIAVAAFDFVRDHVLYMLGPWGVSASTTLKQGEGTCTNKANLLVALLRAAGIPAAYGVLRVNAREYFGAIGPTFLTRHHSAESVHIHAAAFLNGRWVKCDPSTDREMADRTGHFCRQTQLIEWDGANDSLDFLDPLHVFADLGLYANIDELLEKPARAATPQYMALANDYLSFIRDQPPFESDKALFEAYRSARTLNGTWGDALRRTLSARRVLGLK
jgi:uncharacterized membrane protein YdfJ with MMPL/SSD domain